MSLTVHIYECTEGFPKLENYSLSNQLRRAAISVPSNIAEGAARKSSLERKRFFEISRSSLVEIDTQLEIAHRLGYLDDKVLEMLSEQINPIFAMLSNLIAKT